MATTTMNHGNPQAAMSHLNLMLAPISAEFHVTQWAADLASMLAQSPLSGSTTAVDLNVSDLCVGSLTDELRSSIEAEAAASRHREETGEFVVPDMPSDSQIRRRKDRTYHPDPKLLRESLDVSKVPTSRDLRERNVETGLSMFADDAADRVRSSVGRHDPSLYAPTPHAQTLSGPMIDENEIIVSVTIMHPDKMTKSDEFLFLGSHPLSLLRDCIPCPHDHLQGAPKYTSSCFFMEGMFYNDTRNPALTDLSAPILAHFDAAMRSNPTSVSASSSSSSSSATNASSSSSKPRFIGKAAMQESTFLSLPSLRIGAQYLYMHAGDCAHLMVVNEVRRVHPTGDVRYASAYPIHTYRARVRRRKCGVCDLMPAGWVSYGDALADSSPAFFCERCYDALHKDVEGRMKYSLHETLKYVHE
jgi:snRNA-activating protein complex subunit 3